MCTILVNGGYFYHIVVSTGISENKFTLNYSIRWRRWHCGWDLSSSRRKIKTVIPPHCLLFSLEIDIKKTQGNTIEALLKYQYPRNAFNLGAHVTATSFYNSSKCKRYCTCSYRWKIFHRGCNIRAFQRRIFWRYDGFQK